MQETKLSLSAIDQYKLDTFEDDDTFPFEEEFDLKGRNSKQPKKSNHGARPCSSVMRRLKKRSHFRGITVK